MNINGVSSYNRFRLSGLASGIDTDMIVQNMLRIDRMPLDRLTQKKQLAEWRRDDYRSITNMLVGFRNDFFDVLKPSKDMRSPSIYQQYTSKSTHPEIVTATGGAWISSYSHKIKVTQLATAASGTSEGAVTKGLVGNVVPPVGSTDPITIDDYNNSFTLTFNGKSKVITLKNGTYNSIDELLNNSLLKQNVGEAFPGLDVKVNGSALEFVTPNTSDVVTISSSIVSDNLLSTLGVNNKGEGKSLTFPLNISNGQRFSITIAEGDATTTKEIKWTESKTYENSEKLAADIQNMIDTQLGSGKVIVNGVNGKLSFTAGTGVDSITLNNSYKNTEVVGFLGFSSGDSNKLSMSDTMSKMNTRLRIGPPAEGINFDENGNFKLTINGTDVNIKATDTLAMVIDKVNTSKAGVTLSYSTFTDKFTLTSKDTGAGIIAIDDNGSNFFKNIVINQDGITSGVDAQFELDGLAATRRTNSFTIDGVNYNLLGISPDGVETTITLTQNTDATFNSIKEFVDRYNEILDTINGKTSEKYDRNYLPLTDEQKDAMKEGDVKKWEEKAKVGLLRHDNDLESMVTKMRYALYGEIKDVNGGLSSIGITTGNFLDKGKLVIDEDKLREAIKNTPDKVMDIFSRGSSVKYSPDLSKSDRDKRYFENGIVNRLDDILKDYVRTTRDSNGNKGVLIEKAGIAGDTSDLTNSIYEEISGYDEEISKLSLLLIQKENRYYAKFAAMEKALSQMQSQSNWLMAQLGMGSK